MRNNPGLSTQRSLTKARYSDGTSVSNRRSLDIIAGSKLSDGDAEVDQKYLEHLVGVPLVHLETLDGHGQSQVFALAHVCKSTVVVIPPNAYELLSKDIRGGYDATGFANL